MAWSKTDWTARDDEWLTFHVAFRRWILAALLLWPAAGRAQCLPPVSPQSPPYGTVTTETSINFAWTATTTNGYVLYLSRNGGPAKQAEGCANSSSPNCTVTLEPGRYEWFVRTRGDFGCPSECNGESAHYCLLINCNNPVAPTNLKADPGSNVPVQGTKLTWNGSSDDRYDVLLTPGQECSKTSLPLNRTPLTATSLDSGPLGSGETYSWWVRASRDSSCTGPVFSPCATFTVRCVPPEKAVHLPTDTLPQSDLLQQYVVANWKPMPGASKYYFYKNDKPYDFFVGRFTSYCVEQTYFVDFKWKVEAVPGCNTNSTMSDTAEYKYTDFVKKCDPLNKDHEAYNNKYKPKLLTPKPGETLGPGTKVEFLWGSAIDFPCDKGLTYSVWLVYPGGTAKQIGSSEKTNSKIVSFTANRPPQGSYKWNVKIEGHCDVVSDTSQFVVP